MTFGLIVTYVFSVLVFMFLYNYFITYTYSQADKPVPSIVRKRACWYSIAWPLLVAYIIIKGLTTIAVGKRESTGDADLDTVIYDRNKAKESRDRMNDYDPPTSVPKNHITVDRLAEALSEVYDHGTQPNAFAEAQKIIEILNKRT